jgi:hypothetical protein
VKFLPKFILIGILGAAVLLNGCFPNCNEDSEAVAYARSLSPDRLEKLYYDMEQLSEDESVPFSGFMRRDGQDFPEPFRDLEVVKIQPRDENIMIEGCFDHYVYLHFEGFGEEPGSGSARQIILSWGEWEPQAGSQVLWREDESEPVAGGDAAR